MPPFPELFEVLGGYVGGWASGALEFPETFVCFCILANSDWFRECNQLLHKLLDLLSVSTNQRFLILASDWSIASQVQCPHLVIKATQGPRYMSEEVYTRIQSVFR